MRVLSEDYFSPVVSLQYRADILNYLVQQTSKKDISLFLEGAETKMPSLLNKLKSKLVLKRKKMENTRKPGVDDIKSVAGAQVGNEGAMRMMSFSFDAPTWLLEATASLGNVPNYQDTVNLLFLVAVHFQNFDRAKFLEKRKGAQADSFTLSLYEGTYFLCVGQHPSEQTTFTVSVEFANFLIEQGAQVKRAQAQDSMQLDSAEGLLNPGALKKKTEKAPMRLPRRCGQNNDIEAHNSNVLGNKSDNDTQSQLIAAVLNSKGDVDYVKQLVKAKADVNQADFRGRTALWEAVRRGYIDCVQLLLKAGADVNKADEDGQTPLIDAVGRCDISCVKLLLKAGADVNEADIWMRTPLLEAVLFGKGSAPCVKLLLEAGADVNQVGKPGQTPLLVAIGQDDRDSVKLLLEAGTDVNLADNQGGTPLLEVSGTGDQQFFPMLLKAGADVNHADANGQTALLLTAGGGDKAFVQKLLDAGAHVNHTNVKGISALMQAAHWGETPCLKVLLKAGADVNQMNNAGQTALLEAVENGGSNMECVCRLCCKQEPM